MSAGRNTSLVTGEREDEIIPENVTRVKIHSSVRAIRGGTFVHRMQLEDAILNDELEEIGACAFFLCTSLRCIAIPNAVRAIGEAAFGHCSGLTNVTMGEGLVVIGKDAFKMCKSLKSIVIPNAVDRIKDGTFEGCSGLTTAILGKGLYVIGEKAFAECISLKSIVIPTNVGVINNWAFYNCWGLNTITLGEGLREIGKRAFRWCTGLQHIAIPSTVKRIDDSAFEGCTNLTRITFCDKIEEFVSCSAMSGWWNQGLHEKSMSTYCFLVRRSIPDRLGLVQVRCLRANIYKMLRRIPSFSKRCLNAQFDTIHSRLAIYEHFIHAHGEAIMLLELAIPSDDIIMCVLSFLL